MIIQILKNKYNGLKKILILFVYHKNIKIIIIFIQVMIKTI